MILNTSGVVSRVAITTTLAGAAGGLSALFAKLLIVRFTEDRQARARMGGGSMWDCARIARPPRPPPRPTLPHWARPPPSPPLQVWDLMTCANGALGGLAAITAPCSICTLYGVSARRAPRRSGGWC